MPGEIIAEVKEMNLSSDSRIRRALVKKVKVYNHLPKAAEKADLTAILAVYHKDKL